MPCHEIYNSWPVGSFSYIFKAKWHNLICEHAPWGGERGLVLVNVSYLDLIIPIETIHEGEGLVSYTSIDDLVNEWGRVIVLWTCFFQIAKIDTDANGDLFFHDRNRVGNP